MEIVKKEGFQKKYNLIDIVKFILAILIMIIHSAIDKTVISPILRIAVPLFFIISAYFLFSKLKTLDDKKEKRRALGRFIKRNLFLYIIWAIIQLPFVIYFRDYHKDFFSNGLLYTLRDFFNGSGFTGSWFILALVVGIVIVYCLSKKVSPTIILCFCLPIYVMCCFCTNYFNVMSDSPWLRSFFEGYENILGVSFFNSLPGALFWVAVGNFLGKKEFSIKNCYLYIILAISIVLIIIERIIIVTYSLQFTDDCYFSLMLLCPVLFLLILRHNFPIQSGFRFRELSTIIYVTHGSVERVVGFVLKKLPIEFFRHDIFKVIISLALIIVVGYLIIFIKEKSKFKLFKYIC